MGAICRAQGIVNSHTLIYLSILSYFNSSTQDLIGSYHPNINLAQMTYHHHQRVVKGSLRRMTRVHENEYVLQ